MADEVSACCRGMRFGGPAFCVKLTEGGAVLGSCAAAKRGTTRQRVKMIAGRSRDERELGERAARVLFDRLSQVAVCKT
jgi:hypothetical protein